jgi:hypothetical protein
MAEHDLHFAGVVPLHQNFRDTAVSETMEKVFADATDRLTFESLKDFAINEFFRRDVYVKGKTSRSPAALDAFLDATAWEAAIDRFPESRTMKLPHRVLKLEAPIFEPLFLAFREGAATIEELRASRPELAGWPPDQVRAAVLRLLLAELIVPMQRPTKAQAVDPSGKFTVPHPYNQMMLKRLSSDTPLVLASEVAGTALRSSALEVLAMRVLTECRAEERDAWVEAFVEKHEMRLAIDGKIVADRAEQKRHVREAIATLGRDRLAKLVELGIMSPVR